MGSRITDCVVLCGERYTRGCIHTSRRAFRTQGPAINQRSRRSHTPGARTKTASTPANPASASAVRDDHLGIVFLLKARTCWTAEESLRLSHINGERPPTWTAILSSAWPHLADDQARVTDSVVTAEDSMGLHLMPLHSQRAQQTLVQRPGCLKARPRRERTKSQPRRRFVRSNSGALDSCLTDDSF